MSERTPAFVSKRLAFWKILTAIGTLIPGALAIYDWLFYPKYELIAKLHGPFQVGSDKVEFIFLQVENRGRKPLSEVEIWLEKGYRFDDKTQVLPGRQIQGIDINAKRSYVVKASGKFFIISLGLLRPGENTEISIVSKEGALSFNGFGAAYLRSEAGLKSAEVVGNVVKYEAELDEVKTFCHFMVFVSFLAGFLLLILVLVITNAYWKMRPEEREQQLLKELETVRQRLAKSSGRSPGDGGAH